MSWYEPSETPPAPPAYHQQRRSRAWEDYGRSSSAASSDYNNPAGHHYAPANANANAAGAISTWSDAVDYIDYANDGQGPASLAGRQGPGGRSGGGGGSSSLDDPFGGDELGRRLETLLGASMLGGPGQQQQQQQQQRGQGGALGTNPYVNEQEQQRTTMGSEFHGSASGGRWPHPSYQYREAAPTADNPMPTGDDGVDATNYFFHPRRLQYNDAIGSQEYASQRPFVPEFTQSQSQAPNQSQDQGQYEDPMQSHMPDSEMQQQGQSDPGQIQPPPMPVYQPNTASSGYHGGGSTNIYQGGTSYYSMPYGGAKDACRQSTIGVNPSTGALSAVQDDSRYGLLGAAGAGSAAADGTNNIDTERSWAGVGGNVGVFHHTTEVGGGQQAPQPPKPTKKKKGKSKGNENGNGKGGEKSKKKKNQQQQDMVNSLLGFAAGAGKENEADNDEADDGDFEKSNIPKTAATKKKNKSKTKTNKRQKAATLLDLADEDDVFDRARFDGIEECGLLNAGQSQDSLAMFLSIVKTAPSSAVAWTMIFLDRTCSSPFLPMARRYCTDKGPRCTNWNCTCDGQVRAMMASAPLLGAMFVVKIPDEDDDGVAAAEAQTGTSQQNDPNQNATSTSCFILPLGPAKDGDGQPVAADPGYERMSDWPAVFDCETSIPDRWKALRSILLDKQLACVTYNAAVGLLPYHYHRENDGVALGSEGQIGGGQTDLIFPRLWDLVVTSWILNPDRSDAELEFANIYNGFSHLRNNGSASANHIPTNASEQLLGLLKAQDFLEFLLVIYPVIDRQLDQRGLRAAYDDIEGPTTSILSAMETCGIGFVTEPLIALQQKLETRIGELAAEAKNLARDNTFLLSSPQQVAKFLYDIMQITPPELQGVSKGKTKSRSTSEESLKMIQSDAKRKGQQPHRIVEIILEFRSLNKTLTTYARPLPLLARDMSATTTTRKKKRSKRSKKQSTDSSQSIQRIHPNWMQTAVRTGRLSCRKPNIQQVPTTPSFGTNIRDSFRASSSKMCLFACDYSQNEIRILAHMSNDQALIGMFRSREEIDIYRQMSAAIRGIKVENVTDDDRKISKQVTLAILYGMGVPQVASSLSVSPQTARQHLDGFYRRFHGVKRWMDATKEGARRNSYVTTITGRRR